MCLIGDSTDVHMTMVRDETFRRDTPVSAVITWADTLSAWWLELKCDAETFHSKQSPRAHLRPLIFNKEYFQCFFHNSLLFFYYRGCGIRSIPLTEINLTALNSGTRILTDHVNASDEISSTKQSTEHWLYAEKKWDSKTATTSQAHWSTSCCINKGLCK